MQGVMTTPLAILLELDALRIVLLVLLGRVIAALAISARQRDQCSHEFSFYSELSRAFDYTHESIKRRARLMLRQACLVYSVAAL